MSKLNEGYSEDWYEENRRERLKRIQAEAAMSRTDREAYRAGNPIATIALLIAACAVLLLVIVGAATVIKAAHDYAVKPVPAHSVLS